MPGYFSIDPNLPQYNMWKFGGFGRAAAPAVTVGPNAVGTGNLTGTPATDYNAAVGGKPVVPDPLTVAKQAIAAAMANLPTAISGANQINAANQAAALKQITDLYPQFGANTAALGGDIGSWARGEVSPSTMAMLAQGAAERNIAGGFGAGSPNANAAYLRLLGLTSEELQQRALTGQNTLLAGLPRTTPTDPTRLMPSADALTTALYNAQMQANLFQAAPNPADAYNLALSNVMRGLNQGGRAGYTPPAATPTGGGMDANIRALLDTLISRTGSSGYRPLDTGRPVTLPPAAGTPSTGAQGSDAYDLDYLMYGSDPLGLYGGDVGYGETWSNQGGYADTLGGQMSPEEYDFEYVTSGYDPFGIYEGG